MHKYKKIKKTVLILQYLEYSRTVQRLAHGLASSEWARSIADRRREGRRETAELKGRRQQQREGRLQLHSHLTFAPLHL